MPLLDHFHPPLSVNRRWESLHATWTVCLADALTPLLPEGYFVEVQTHAGTGVEIDVATFEDGSHARGQGNGTTAVAMPVLPTPTWSFPAVLPAVFEVRILSTASGPTLVGAIELVSPANKDRPETRRAFATKCASYLYQGVSLIVVDVVTERAANLHNEAMRIMEAGESCMADDECLYAVAYRPVRRESGERIDVWARPLVVGKDLPALPLVLGPELHILVNLEASYAEACLRRRLS